MLVYVIFIIVVDAAPKPMVPFLPYGGRENTCCKFLILLFRIGYASSVWCLVGKKARYLNNISSEQILNKLGVSQAVTSKATVSVVKFGLASAIAVYGSAKSLEGILLLSFS